MKLSVPAIRWVREYDKSWLCGDTLAGITLAAGTTLIMVAIAFIAWMGKAGVRFQAVEARSSVRDRLRAEGVDEQLGGVNRFSTVADVVEAIQEESGT